MKEVYKMLDRLIIIIIDVQHKLSNYKIFMIYLFKIIMKMKRLRINSNVWLKGYKILHIKKVIY